RRASSAWLTSKHTQAGDLRGIGCLLSGLIPDESASISILRRLGGPGLTTLTSGGGHYTIAVCKGSALLQETKVLLRAWQPNESLSEFRDRVLREDLLGKMTAYRVNDIVRRVFARRFLRPDLPPARLLKQLVERDYPDQLFSDLCLVYAARSD